MARAQSLSNFAGLSGIFAGMVAIAGAFGQRLYVMALPPERQTAAFVLNWATVVAAAVAFDYWHVCRRSADVDRALAVRLFRHQARAAWPALFTGIVLTVAFLGDGRPDLVYPYWMLCYGCAVCAAALGGAIELAWLGRAFLASGAIVLLLQVFGPSHFREAQLGLAAIIPTFGLLNIAYGVMAGRRAGW